jgi:hypothetical protein
MSKNILLLKNKILLSSLTVLSIITALYIRLIGAINIEIYTIDLYSNNPETFLLKDYS